MSSIESYDGLCGCIHHNSSSERRVRCNYEFGHAGEHSWANKTVGLTIFAGAIANITWKPEALHLPGDGKRKKVVIGY